MLRMIVKHILAIFSVQMTSVSITVHPLQKFQRACSEIKNSWKMNHTLENNL